MHLSSDRWSLSCMNMFCTNTHFFYISTIYAHSQSKNL